MDYKVYGVILRLAVAAWKKIHAIKNVVFAKEIEKQIEQEEEK